MHTNIFGIYTHIFWVMAYDSLHQYVSDNVCGACGGHFEAPLPKNMKLAISSQIKSIN